MPQLGSLDGTRGFARNLWNMLRDGGTWTVPRCGLVYRKHEEERTLVLVDQMPWMEGMPFSPEEIRVAQLADHVGITDMFRSIDVQVVKG